MLRSLVGSEMCIRDSFRTRGLVHSHLPCHGCAPRLAFISQYNNAQAIVRHLYIRFISIAEPPASFVWHYTTTVVQATPYYPCLLYTSDAADEEDSVDLGGRRIIKKKKINKSSELLLKRCYLIHD
eukprot:TRINITY_DN51897_c0_g1_i1.p1 TRINITY_DN51897_c0_g1~~TRINITY_DN51897_c0_g1_i1.p1  ORF type:complete len:126 (-),score=18.51 TRINITY_DN51897_c0_g1_i1:32-409(-)